jgi:hypothetical protein
MTTVSTLVILILGAIQVTLLVALVLLGVIARRKFEYANLRSDGGWGVPITDEVEVVAADAQAAAAAAERALEEADQAQNQAVHAAAARDMAERRCRFVLKQADAAGEPYRLVQRAALNAYRSRQLSVEELNRIWQHTQVMMVEPAPSPTSVPPLAWELRVREARRQYEQAAAEAARVQEEARLKTVTATILAEESRAAEAQLAAALHSANTGLVGLLRAAWADAVTD